MRIAVRVSAAPMAFRQPGSLFQKIDYGSQRVTRQHRDGDGNKNRPGPKQKSDYGDKSQHGKRRAANVDRRMEHRWRTLRRRLNFRLKRHAIFCHLFPCASRNLAVIGEQFNLSANIRDLERRTHGHGIRTVPFGDVPPS